VAGAGLPRRRRPTLLRTTEIIVELPREHAMALFTPEGERRWGEGWDAHYPKPGRHEDPGVVFTTRHETHETTWIMVDRRPETIRYASRRA
jgi:hypothetical protein